MNKYFGHVLVETFGGGAIRFKRRKGKLAKAKLAARFFSAIAHAYFYDYVNILGRIKEEIK